MTHPRIRPSSRRALLTGAAGGASWLALAACGGTRVIEKIVVYKVVQERAVVIERAVEVIRVVTVLATPTPAPTPTPTSAPTATPTATPTPTLSPTAVVTPTPAIVTPAVTPQAPIVMLDVGLHAGGHSVALQRTRLQGFLARRQDVELEIERLEGGRAGLTALIARGAAGALPDVLTGLGGDALAALAAQESLAPLDARSTPSRDFTPELLALGRVDGSLVGAPVAAYPTYFYVNPAALERAGVDAIGPTYPDRLETARRLTDRETHRYGWGVAADLPELETVAGSSGTGVWDAGHEIATLDADGFVVAWQWYADLIHRHEVSPPPDAWDSLLGAHGALLSGRIAMTLRSGWVLEALAREAPRAGTTWDLVPLPFWEGASRRVPVQADYAAVATGAPATAVELALYLASESLDPITDAGLPSWAPALDRFAARWGVSAQSLLEARAAWTRPALDVPGADQVADALMPAIAAVIRRGEPASSVAPELARRLTAIRHATSPGAAAR